MDAMYQLTLVCSAQEAMVARECYPETWGETSRSQEGKQAPANIGWDTDPDVWLLRKGTRVALHDTISGLGGRCPMDREKNAQQLSTDACVTGRDVGIRADKTTG